MRHYAYVVLTSLFAMIHAGVAATDEPLPFPDNPMQFIAVKGYRLAEGGELHPLSDLSGLSVTPTEGHVYSNAVAYTSNQNVFTADVPFGYRVAKWKKAYGDDQFVFTLGEDVEGSEGAASVTIPWDGRGNIYLALILEFDNTRTVTLGKSPFGAGTIGTNLDTYTCMKGDVFQLNALPAHDDKTGFDRSDFRRWSDGVTDARRTVVVDTNLTLFAEFVPKSWQVAFDANGGSVCPTSKCVTCDASYGWLPTPVRLGHKFDGWFSQPEEGTPVGFETPVGAVGDHILYAEWTPLSYKVDVVYDGEGNGTVEGTGSHPFGSEVNLTAKAYEGSVFAGWTDGESRNPRLVTVTSNATYGARFEVKTYDVTFTYRNAEGREVVSSVQTVRHGEAATPPAASEYDSWPDHYFKTWSSDAFKSVTDNLTGDRSVSAIYDVETFAVTFVYHGRDGNAVTTMPQHVVAGMAAVPPPDTVANNWPGHERTGWQPDFSVIRTNLTVVAVYDEYCTVDYAVGGEGNGRVEGIGTYLAGKTVELTAKAYEGSVFVGWADGETRNPRRVTVTSNVVYGAVFDVATYDVTFTYRDAQGREVITDVQTVRHGAAAVPPETSAYTSWPYHTFKTWSTEEYKKVTRNLTGNDSVRAIYDEETFAVTFVYQGRDGNAVTTMPQHVVAGMAAVPPPDSVANNWAGHTRVDWQPDYSVVRSDLTVEAVYVENPESYTVDYVLLGEGNGRVEGIGTYLADKTVELTAKAYEGSVFVGWADGETRNPRRVTVTSNVVYGAVFDVATYDVTFTYRDAQGREVVTDVQTVRHGAAAVPPETSAYTSWPYHIFKTWSTEEYKKVTRDLTGNQSVRAIYDEETFAVTFVYQGRDGNAVTTMPQHVVAGASATPPPDSVANNWAGHTRVDWQPDYSVVRSDLTVEAVYEENPESYTVDYVLLGEGNGRVEGIGTYLAGKTVELTAKAYEGSVFVGWADGETRNPRRVTVTSNVVYGAVFDVATYDVTFTYRDAQGREVVTDVQTVRHGAAAVPPETSAYTSWPYHTFKTWSTEEYKKVTRDLTGNQSVSAIYDEETFAVTFVYRNHDGNAETTMPQYVVAGAAAVPPKDDVANNWVGHTRVGWQPDYNVIRSDLTVEAVYAEDQEICSIDCTVSGDGTGSVEGGGSYLLGTTVTLRATPAEGSIFVCWENGETTNPRSVTVSGDAVYTARFDAVKPDEYTHIYYYANEDHTEIVTNVYTNFAGSVQLAAADTFTKTGYILIGWTNTTQKILYEAGDSFEVKKGEDYHFDAQWEPIKYRLEFNGNGQGDEVTMVGLDAKELTYDVPFTLTSKYPDCYAQRSFPWKLVGWDRNPNCEPEPEKIEYRWKAGDSMTVTNLTTEAGGTVIFYAIWDK